MSKHFLVRGDLATFQANAISHRSPAPNINTLFFPSGQADVSGPYQVGSSPILKWFEVCVTDDDVIAEMGADESGPMAAILGNNAALRGLYQALAAQGDRQLIRNDSNQPVCVRPAHGRAGHNIVGSATHGVDPNDLPVLSDLNPGQ